MSALSQPARRIVVVTAGHLSTCPRMLKAADALSEAGYDVRMVSANFSAWAHEADLIVRRTRTWRWTVVDYSKQSAPAKAVTTSLRWRLATHTAGLLRQQAPWWAVTRAYSRVHGELMAAALSEPADLYYGGTTGGLAPTAEAALRAGKPYALDLEDWHLGERAGDDARLQHAMAERITSRVLSAARFLTTSTDAMADAYERTFGMRPATIHNVFPLPATPAGSDASGDRLRICWFGQTIGPGRGIEDIVDIAVAANVPVDLDIRGRIDAGFLAQIEHRAASGGDVRLTILAPVDPDALVAWCRTYHIGMYADPPLFENRMLCVSNKIFTYLLAGLAVVAIETPAHQPLAVSTGRAINWFKPGDITAAAAAVGRLHACRDALRQARADSWSSAVARWHWEHPAERGTLLALARQVFA